MLKVNLVGPGKVGQTLLRLIAATGLYDIQDVAGTSTDKAATATAFVGAGRPVGDIGAMAAADIWLITVPDTAIAHVAARLADSVAAPATDRPLAIHCSGFLPSTVMRPLTDRNWRLASLHPVMSFADPETASTRFAGTYCGVEGDADAMPMLHDLVAALGGKAFAIRSEDKAIYHAAAVFANNFTVVLQDIARAAWARAGVPSDAAQAIGANLLQATADNVKALGPALALTGPAARGDRVVVDQQQREVEAWLPEAGALYRQLSMLAGRLKQTGSVTPEDGER